MKTLELKPTEIKNGEKAMTYGDLAILCLNSHPANQGLSVDEMRKRLRVIDTLEKSETTANIEDADIETLKSCVNVMTWGALHKDIVAFSDAVKAL